MAGSLVMMRTALIAMMAMALDLGSGRAVAMTMVHFGYSNINFDDIGHMSELMILCRALLLWLALHNHQPHGTSHSNVILLCFVQNVRKSWCTDSTYLCINLQSSIIPGAAFNFLGSLVG